MKRTIKVTSPNPSSSSFDIYSNNFFLRKILSGVGLDWLKPAHKNNHGSQSLTKQKIWKILKHSTVSEIQKIIKKYEKDFELCGYDWTLETLQKIIEIKTKKMEANIDG